MFEKTVVFVPLNSTFFWDIIMFLVHHENSLLATSFLNSKWLCNPGDYARPSRGIEKTELNDCVVVLSGKEVLLPANRRFPNCLPGRVTACFLNKIVSIGSNAHSFT